MTSPPLDRTKISLILESLRSFPVTLLQGARQTGKSFLLQALLDQGAIKEIRTLDDYRELMEATERPHEYIESLPKPIGLDEIQRAPGLMLAIKKYVDQHKKPGDFILTGSANIFSYPDTMDSLAGRMHLISLQGVSLGESLRKRGPFNLFSHLIRYKELSFASLQAIGAAPTDFNLWDCVFYGGFPDVRIRSQPRDKANWFQSYISAYIQRDVRDLTKDTISFYKFFEYLGCLSGQQFVLNSASSDLEVDQRTLRHHLEILEITYQVSFLQPFFTNRIKRLVKTPKIFFQDTGLLTYLLNITEPSQILTHPFKGAILETWLYNEIVKLIDGEHMRLHYFRQQEGFEVDFVVSQGECHILVECKASLPTAISSMKGIAAFREKFPESPVIIFHGGDLCQQVGPNIYALPFWALCATL